METKTNFGPDQLTKKTPAWANWLFGSVFISCTVAIQVVGGDTAITDAVKVRVINYLNGVSGLIFAVSRMFGVKVKSDENSTA